MPKLISCLGLNKSVCPKTEYVIPRKTFHFETALDNIWKDVSLSHCLTISVRTSLFSVMAMDPRGLRFSAMKCEFSYIDWNTEGDVSQSGRSMSLKIQTHLIAGLAPEVEWDHIQLCSAVPSNSAVPWNINRRNLTSLNLFYAMFSQRGREVAGTYCWQRSNKQSLCGRMG